MPAFCNSYVFIQHNICYITFVLDILIYNVIFFVEKYKNTLHIEIKAA